MNNWVPNTMLKYRPDGREQLGRLLRRPLDEDEIGILRPNS
jgi:hypothetical protein